MENSEAEKDADTHENVNAQSEGARAIGGGKEERPKNCGSWKRELEKNPPFVSLVLLLQS